MIHRLFPTCVLTQRLPLAEAVRTKIVSWLTELCHESIEHREARVPAEFYGLHQSPEIAPLLGLICREVDRYLYDELNFMRPTTTFYIGRCWPVIRFRNGGITHSHPGAVFSGVFYLQLPEGAGGIEFLKPFRTAADTLFKTPAHVLSTTVVQLDVGECDLCLFNSELMHRSRRGTIDHVPPVVAVAFDLFSMTDMHNVTGGIPHSQFLRELTSFFQSP
jgi:uncharacterized protein (TIGR02466 family)